MLVSLLKHQTTKRMESENGLLGVKKTNVFQLTDPNILTKKLLANPELDVNA